MGARVLVLVSIASRFTLFAVVAVAGAIFATAAIVGVVNLFADAPGGASSH